ncbi:hypothetical protein Cadr_000002678 [Camelus dromedarius]|uniref:Uncharacterized protein n=1 Tax=Camelus dromedarius TaxID=9838 RepID=A0A5N4C3S3_CAMDR|nr:hypothetical protein Cadr_000002678 [Camelus dromedarius]
MGACLCLEISQVRRLAGAACPSMVSQSHDTVDLGRKRWGQLPTPCFLPASLWRLEDTTEGQVGPDSYQPDSQIRNTPTGERVRDLAWWVLKGGPSVPV